MKRLAFLMIALALAGAFFARGAHAQVQDGTTTGISSDAGIYSTDEIPSDISSYDSSVNPSDIEADVFPENPGAFTTVTITLDSNLIDLRRYMISWYIGGKLVGQGTGKTVLLAKTGTYGQTVAIRASISLAGSTIVKDILLTPQDMTLMWEAVDGYAPAFYQGKKLPVRESAIKIISIPNFISNGRTINPADAVYNWQRNGSVVTEASGYGTDALLIRENRLRTSETIKATASDQGNNVSSTGTITVPTFDPKVLFYSIDPTTGIKSPLATQSLFFTAPSATVIAEPYFMSVLNGNPNSLKTSWSMNDNPITVLDLDHRTELTLQNPGTAGSATVTASITNPRSLFQSAQGILGVSFTQP